MSKFSKNIYFLLTEQFNHGRTRVVLSSGQAVVWYGLSLMSKDGDWIVRDDQESLDHILSVLSEHNAKYRFGAPLDKRWLENGWSSHFEFSKDGVRVRCDFVAVPPRVSPSDIERIWEEVQKGGEAVLPKDLLIPIKATQRAKDYPIIAELSKEIQSPGLVLSVGRDARSILVAAGSVSSSVLESAMALRPALKAVCDGVDALEVELFKEQQILMKRDAERMAVYSKMAELWSREWLRVDDEINGLSLMQSHKIVTENAEKYLPFSAQG